MNDKNFISRRDFLKLGATGLAVTGLSSLFSNSALKAEASAAEGHPKTIITNKNIKIMKPKSAIRYDMVDSHLHFTDFLQKSDGFPALTKAMDLAGVSEAVVFGMAMAKQWDSNSKISPAYYLSDNCRCYYYTGTDYIVAEELQAQPKEIRERFYPFICGINGNDRFSVEHIRRLLRLYPDFWCGIGELMSRHDDLTALTYGEPAHVNHPAFMEIFDLAAEEKLPVLVHHNITAQSCEDVIYLDELEEALEHNRNCNIIWAHVGISRRVEIQNLDKIADRLLATHPNLYIDISWVVYDYYFCDKFPDNYNDGNTMEDWANLIRKYPDRIMIGTDKVGHWATYPAEAVKYYNLLDMLDDVTAKKLCHDNILKLVKTY